MHGFFRLLGRLTAALVGAAALPASAERPRIDVADGTAFMRDVGGAMLRVIGDGSLNARAREDALRATYRAAFDGDALAARVAGPAWRGASAARRAEFARLLERYFAKVVAARLGDFAGARFEVAMSEPDGGGLTVYSWIAGRAGGPAVNLRWRLAKHGTGFRIHDVVVENVSVSLHVRRTLLDGADSRVDRLAALARRLEALLAGRDPVQSGATP